MIRKPLILNNGKLEQLRNNDTLANILKLINGEIDSITIGQPVFIQQYNSAARRAVAWYVPATNVIGLCVKTITSGQTGLFQVDGKIKALTTDWDAITDQTGGLTVGSIYFLSNVSYGKITKVRPTTIGHYIVKLGIAISSTEFQIMIGTPIKL